MEGFDLRTVEYVFLGKHYCSAMYLGDTLIWPDKDYSKEYFTLEITSAGTVTLGATSSTIAKTISYSTDNGSTWTELTTSMTAQSLGTFVDGDKILLKGDNTTYGTVSGSSYYYNRFAGTAKFRISGNIMSLLYGDNFENQTDFPPGSTYTFYGLFNSAAGPIDAYHLILPATTLVDHCYSYFFSDCRYLAVAPALPATTLANSCYWFMFKGCDALTDIPNLPATTLASDCYSNMFKDCDALTEIPELKATVLAPSCYKSMFQDCRNLVKAPELPATILADSCYNFMFYGCSSLQEAPVLPALTLVHKCYGSMFQNCSKLKKIKAMFTTTPGTTYTEQWVKNISTTGTFIKNSAATWNVTGWNGVPSHWTIKTADA